MRNLICWQAPLLVGLLLAFLLTACDQTEANSGDSATTGRITVYTAMDRALAEKYVAGFSQQYPRIEVNLVRESTGIILQRLYNEADNPKADVVWGVAVTVLLLAEWHDLLEPYAPPGLERIPPLFRDTNSPPNWVGNDVNMAVFCVNLGVLEAAGLSAPRSWRDLLDPEYEGRLVMPDPAASETGYLVVSDLLYLYGEQEGWKYLDGLDQNTGQYTDSGAAPCRLAAAGDYAVGVSSDSTGIALTGEGQPLEIIFPRRGSGWGVRAAALVRKDEPHKAAQTFLDWTISDEAMELYAQDRALTAITTGLPRPEGFPADPSAHLLDKDIPWTAANRSRIIREWLARYGSSNVEASD